MSQAGSASGSSQVDVVVVGAGFAGLSLLHRLRGLGLSVRAFDAAGDVGGTWYWNRYPGARCDIPTTDYTLTFDPELEHAWTWSEKYATQPEILRYAQFIADRYDLRRDIQLETRVEGAEWDDAARRWRVRTDTGEQVDCRFYVMASGCLSLPKAPDVQGADRFTGDVYYTSTWPHGGVDFTGKRVAVIGTGSSGVQSIPLIAQQAAQLTVFQRTANYSIPARNGPAPSDRLEQIAADRETYREAAKWSKGGIPYEISVIPAATAPEDVRRQRLEAAWETGELFAILGVFADQGVNAESNEIVAEFVREKIRAVVDDPEVAETLCPKDHPLGTKRPCLDTGYFQTFNLPHVRLVDLRRHALSTVTETGIDLVDESLEFDVIVYATGFDAMTGPLVNVDIAGRGGVTLKEKWADGPQTYLGLTTAGFPNFFAITGPGSPSVLSNMAVSIEQHVDYVSDLIAYMREKGFETVEPTTTAEAGWDQHVADCAAITLYTKANSWYMGANVPGKPRVFYPYIGGVEVYRAACEEVRQKDYLGLSFTGPAGTVCNDGVVRELQYDVMLVLDLMATMELPPIESLPVPDARAFVTLMAAERPPGPDVGEVVDGELPGAAGTLGYRLYRPATPGPHPLVAYFHGGGWVLGDLDSDDPLCRDLCDRTGAVIVSVNYRHAPEDRFPAAADDAFAAVQWIADNAIALGGIPGQLAVAGWSAGANVATVACHLARDAGGPDILGQLLLTPAVDTDTTTGSYRENADGYVLTAGMMRWFFDHYVDEADRSDPKVAPLRGDLRDLPPALVVTADFDPLRDEGIAYAQGLQAAGTDAVHLRARGHTHTSVTMVDVVLSGAPVREEMAAWLRNRFPALVPA